MEVECMFKDSGAGIKECLALRCGGKYKDRI